ncbi:hypothetical protein Raf01_38460 [Rugosimonospora africana]|uniref:Transmembrane secretion effector n=1 Tax=Rugosimonospora africana TaxID=556532 RepID=A0A8J3QS70_9ACTN|nr:hypothetical protein Raf01_38460 [Rugosimonospora africana]
MLTYQASGSATLTAAVAALEALPYLLLGLFAGAAWGALTRIVGRQRLAEANSALWATEVVLQISVPAGAGLLAAVTDPSIVICLDAGSYLVSAALIAALRGDIDPARRTAARVRAEIAEGLRYLWSQPVVRTLSLTGFALSMTVGGALGLLVVQAHQGLGLATHDTRIGLLYSAGACGSLAGALLLPRVTRLAGAGPASILGYAVNAVCLAGFAVARTLPVAMAVWAVWYVATTTAITNGISVRQQVTPDALQGRVNTTGRMLAWGGTPFGALLGGVLAGAAGTRVAYLALVVPVAVGLAALLLSPVRRLRTPQLAT